MALLLISDLDRTLLNAQGVLSPRSVEVLEACREKGIQISFATARPLRAIFHLCKDYQPDYVIANNGASIYRWGESPPALLGEFLLERASLEELIPVLRDNPLCETLSLEVGDCILTTYAGNEDWGPGWNPVYNDLKGALPAAVPKMTVNWKAEEDFRQVMSRYPQFQVYGNLGEPFYQLMAAGVSKGAGVNKLLESQGISSQDTIAFGDDENDISLFQACGQGIAVANAIPELKAVANEICDENREDGVANWIAKRMENPK